VDFSRVPAASLLRAAADGELDAEGEARLGEHLSSHPGAERRIAFDAGLRGACGRAMSGVSAPAGLADRVRAAVERDARIQADEDAAYASGIAARSSETRERSFWQTGTGRAVAGLAAVLVLAVAGGVPELVAVGRGQRNDPGCSGGEPLPRAAGAVRGR
jgi:anti-sigma factor RsiW